MYTFVAQLLVGNYIACAHHDSPTQTDSFSKSDQTFDQQLAWMVKDHCNLTNPCSIVQVNELNTIKSRSF